MDAWRAYSNHHSARLHILIKLRAEIIPEISDIQSPAIFDSP